MHQLPEELRKHAARQWQSLCAAAQEAGLPIPELSQPAHWVMALSDFVAHTTIRDPRILIDLDSSGDLHRDYRPGEYLERLAQQLSQVRSESELADQLRRVRKREMVRLAWRDISGQADLVTTMLELSAFADACLGSTLGFLYPQLCAQYGTPHCAGGEPQQLVVIAMGKLGGNELNFSSDIDLIFAYPEPGQTVGRDATISNEAFFVRLCRRLVDLIGKKSAAGPLFRVDLRLRPFGDSGPLVMSFDGMEAYYQDQGREWERYAWIKARVAAGDKQAGQHLLERLKPFVYRRFLDYGTFEALRDMKQKITLEVRRQGMQNNIKVGAGGIREIEFFAQIFQLLRGGVVPVLQERSLLKVLDTLAAEAFVPLQTCRKLARAYVFLRNCEHRLQMFADQQTHLLPGDQLWQTRLALAMGFDAWPALAGELDQYRQYVHHQFNSLLKTKDQASEEEQSPLNKELAAVCQGLCDPEQASQTLAQAGFSEPEAILQHIETLRADMQHPPPSKQGQDRLGRLIPLLLETVGRDESSDATLPRLFDLIRAIRRRTCYLALLLENPAVLTHLVKLTAASPMVASLLKRHPLLLDELLDQRTLFTPPEKQDLQQQIRKRIDRLPPDDLELHMEELRVFKQVNALHVAAADVTGVLPLMKVSDHLTYIAETVVHQALYLTWRHLAAKHGPSSCAKGQSMAQSGFTVVAYGKLGGLELSYGSDLDLVFLHAGCGGHTSGPHPIEDDQFYARLGQRILHMLSAHTNVGRLYEADMRLRPSGSAGLLVSQIDAFRDYQLNQAWTWEHQALIRARPICGDEQLTARFQAIRCEVLAKPRDAATLAPEVAQMRAKMRQTHLKGQQEQFDLKQSPGGIVDIEFLVQYLILLHAHGHEDLTVWTDNVRQLQSLAQAGVIDDATAHLLREAYLVYRSTAHKLSLQEKQALAARDAHSELARKVVAIWNQFLPALER